MDNKVLTWVIKFLHALAALPTDAFTGTYRAVRRELRRIDRGEKGYPISVIDIH